MTVSKNFDYKNFITDICVQAEKLIPYDINESQTIYAWYSGRTYAKLWARMEQAFRTNSHANQAGAYLETNCCTAFRDATGLRARSKSGWIHYGSLIAQNEGGVVYASNGTYVYTVLSEYAGNWSTYHRIHRALNALHNEIQQ